MKKIARILTITIVFCALIILFGGSKVQAAVTVAKDVYSNNGSMKFTFSGLELHTDTKTYEFAFTKQKAEEITKWNDLTEVTDTTATVNITTTTKEFRDVINTGDTGYITIREKGEEATVVLPAYAVDLKIPYLQITNYTNLANGKEFDTYDVKVPLRSSQNSQAYYQYEKVTDEAVINQYKEIKAQNGDFSKMESVIKKTPPKSGWSSWRYWGQSYYGVDTSDMDGHGYPVSKVNVSDSGLYYMWVYFSGDSIKDLYGCILVDNLKPDIKLEDVSLPKTASVELGKTLTLTPTFNPSDATNKIVTWKSSNEAVAKVDNNGKITPIKVGSTIITITSEDGNKTASCTVTVVASGSTGTGSQGTGSGSQGTGSGNGTGSGSQGTGSGSTSGSGSQNGGSGAPAKDNTTLQGKLPQTGMTYAGIVVAVAIAGIGVVSFKKYKKYNV